MTVHIGPIARIVVKKAAVQAQTTDEFYALLADQAGDGVDKRRVLKLLRSRMD